MKPRRLTLTLMLALALTGLAPLAACVPADPPAPKFEAATELPERLPEPPAPELPGIKSPAPEPFEAEQPELKDPEPSEVELPEVQNPELEQRRYWRVSADGLNVRAGAGISHPVLGVAQNGTLLAHAEQRGDWLGTLYRGRRGYISAQYAEAVDLPAADERTEAVIREGEPLLGTPYVYGAVRFHDGDGRPLKGFTAEEFDCSSLMQYIFYRGAGVILGTTTRTQVLQGKRVQRDALVRGDLLFFTNAARRNKTGIERVGHVALYLGEGYILHTASDFAKIEPIGARWENFLEARRVL